MTSLAETRALLEGQSRGRFGRLAPELVASLALGAASGGDFAVAKAAFDALARRYAFARRDELSPTHATTFGAPPLGDYTTAGAKGKRAGERPYVTRIVSLGPVVTRCSCPDFVRSGLGICKHGLVVLESLGALVFSACAGPEVDVAWDPFVPLEGSRDRLARLVVRRGGAALAPYLDGPRPSAEALASPESRAAFVDALTLALERTELTADPSVGTLLADEGRAAHLRAEAARALPRSLATLTSLARPLYPYQRAGVEHVLASGRTLLADDMGLGKTTQAIAVCHALLASERARKVVVVCPVALRSQWRREWEATTGAAPIVVVEGSREERARAFRAVTRGAVVVGYEQLLRDLAHVLELRPDVLVVDEAQRVKNWATKSSACVRAIDAKYTLVLTGTPMENRLDELASLMDLVDDGVLEPKWRLAAEHVTSGPEGDGPATGARGLAGLRARLAPVFLRRARKDVLADLPPRTDIRVPVELTAEQREKHDELLVPISQLLALSRSGKLAPGSSRRLLALLAEQRMLCNGIAHHAFATVWPRIRDLPPTDEVRASLHSPKLSVLRALVERVVVDQGRKALIFSQFRSMLQLAEWAVRDVLAAAKKRAVFFTGAEGKAERERALEAIRDDDTCAVLFASDAGGVGLNLQDTITACIELELPWSPQVREQRIGRIHRLGQTAPIDVYDLVSEEGLEGRIAGLLERKSALFTAVLDDTRDEVELSSAESLFSAIGRLVDPVPLAAAESNDDAAASDAGDVGDVGARGAGPRPAAEEPRLAGITVTHLADGGVRVEAAPGAARALLAALEKLEGRGKRAARRG